MPTPIQTTTSDTHAILATIVATIGPASDSPDMVRRLIEAGVGVFRFNFSHGDFAAHERRLKTVREVASQMNRTVACLGDLQGPKIRVGDVPAGIGSPSPSGGGMIEVSQGQDVIFKAGLTNATIRQGSHGPELVLPITYQDLVREVEPGQKVLINDGAIRMLAVEADQKTSELRCRVTSGGLISSHKGINLPQSQISAPAITDRDWECAQWAVQHDMDYLALSFVRTADEINDLKNRISTLHPDAWIPIVAKIEKPQAVANLASIVVAADAVMVARGDLGVEMDIARVPVVQKEIIACCARHGKPSIVATQMLESMIENSSPTRAEASDVANAIFDGADAVMLSAETATGKHPALVVETMARIVEAAEDRLRSLPQPASPPSQLVAAHLGTAALAHGAWAIAQDLDAKIVACWSQNGGTARYLSQNRFNIPIIACSSSAQATRRMALLRGVTPVLMNPPPSGKLSDWNAMVDQYVQSRNQAKKCDAIVLLAGRPLGQAKATNTIAICKVGESTGYVGS
jgi:pyruvate kinase